MATAATATDTALSMLPEEMETEVLLRVPVKSVLRFSVVCRRWAALLSSEEFRAAWTKLAESTTTEAAAQLMFLSLTSINDRFKEVRSGDGRLLVTIDSDRGYSVGMAPAPCHGLTLMHGPVSQEQFHVFNAATRATLTLPPTASCQYNRAAVVHSTAGLGFDARAKQHKVVRLFNDGGRPEDSFIRIKCDLYTLGKGPDRRWRLPSSIAADGGIVPSTLAGAALLTAILYNMTPVFVDGILHWIVNTIYNFMNSVAGMAVLSFSVADETFCSCVRPPPFDWDDKGSAHLMELGGRLCMVRDLRRNSNQLEIWSYNNGGDCWSLEHCINLAAQQYVGRDDLIQPLYVRVLGLSVGTTKVIFIATSKYKVVAFDQTSGTLETILQFGPETSWDETTECLTTMSLFKESLSPVI